MTTTALKPLTGRVGGRLALAALLLLAAGCAPPGQVGYTTAERAAMDALHASYARASEPSG